MNIVWFKRDLRLEDHPPLQSALADGVPVLLLYLFEPAIISDTHYSVRHWRFVWQSLMDLQERLKPHRTSIQILHGNALVVFDAILREHPTSKVFSHHEVGLQVSRARDAALRTFFNDNKVRWLEMPQDGIVPNARHRRGWEEQRAAFLREAPAEADWQGAKWVELPQDFKMRFPLSALSQSIFEKSPSFQQGGATAAHAELRQFLAGRCPKYTEQISKPALNSSSRLSPYLAYGCISMRQVAKEVKKRRRKDQNLKRQLDPYLSRLFWRSHYMQQLDTEPELQHLPMNRALACIERGGTPELREAWVNGQTGFPMIDAAMRCLRETGFLNFRIRATLATFATFPLWQEWQDVARHLARLSLDFEPGIHYGQMQIQAGLTGYHTVRVFSPTAQSSKHDPEGVFVKKWLPELRGIPKGEAVGKPWLLSAGEQQRYGCILGKDYPECIVDEDIATKIAQNHYWRTRQTPTAYDALPEILERHCLPGDKANYERFRRVNWALETGMEKKGGK